MERAEAKAAEKREEAVKRPAKVGDILEMPGVRIVPSHTLKTVWSYFKKFPHDFFPVFKDVFSDEVEGAIYPQSILLLKDRADDKRVGDVENNAPVVKAGASLEELYNLLKRGHVGAIVVDEGGKYLGIATVRGLLEALKSMEPKAKSVNAVFTGRGEGQVEFVDLNDDARSLADKIAGGEAAGAVVVDKKGFIQGVVTVWDYIARSIWLRPRREPRSVFGKASRGEAEARRGPPVRALMSSGVPAVTPSTPIEDAAAAMASLGVYVLPVVDREGRVLGALTALDVARAYFEGAKPGREDITVERPSAEAAPAAQAALTPLKYATGVRLGELMTTNIPTVGLLDTISHVRRVMLKTGAHVVAVVDESGRPVGFISRRDLLLYIAEKSLGYWKIQKGKRLVLRESVMPGERAKLLREEGTASDVLRLDAPKLPATATAEEAAYAMLAAGVDYVLVVGEGGDPQGVVTKEALVRAYAERGREDAVVAELMTPADIAVVNPLHSLPRVVDRMKSYELDGVVVAEGNDVKGIIADSRLSLAPVEESLRGEKIFVITKYGDKRSGGSRLRYPKAGTLTAMDIADDPPPPVPPNLKAKEAARLLLERDVLPVLDQKGKMVGVLTKFDIVRDLARAYVSSKSPEAPKEAQKEAKEARG
ncbi:MAG: CBS domain-containing protein [Thermoproteus sp. AZ2]|jgi:CBS domain-containing protein|uniref:CBS domain-containing protein n=1 Tax=Thermoproteus sp. AZ2 TaxID=1609232 RepID=A0ACC6V124_9CREN|nr:MAG: multiple CBS domains containing protein [Thermoproteus sp. AZ2]